MDNPENVPLIMGRDLTRPELESLMQLIDRFMEHRIINLARHSDNGADEVACDIEHLMTVCGWYANE